MTAPRPVGPFDEFLPPSSGLFDEFLPAEESKPRPPLSGQALAGRGFAPDAVARIAGATDPDAWQSAMRRPGAVERNVLGALDLPFALGRDPVGTVKAVAKATVTDPFKPGMYAAKKLNQALGLPGPSERFDVSGEEALMAGLNTALMAGGALKATKAPSVVAEPVRVPMAGIVRTPAEQAAFRLAQIKARRGSVALPTEGEVPLRVPFPPAEKPYPFGAAAGERGGAKALEASAATIEKELKHLPTEPAASPFAKGGITRRPAGTPGPFDEFVPPEVTGPQELIPTPTAGEVPLTVPFPPAERAYPLGATTGDIRSGPQGAVRHPMQEPLPTPYARQGVVRRPATEPPSPVEWEAAQPSVGAVEPPAPKPAEPVATIGGPVSFGREPILKGKEPTFNTGVVFPDETASVGALPPVPKGPMEVPQAFKVRWRGDEIAPPTPPAPEPPVTPIQAKAAPIQAVEVPDPVRAPREFINYARTGLSQTENARLRSTVESLRASGELAKQVVDFDTQAKMAATFKRELLSNPLDIDFTKMGKLSGPEAVAVRQTLAENVQLEEGIAKALRSGELDPAQVTEATTMLDQLATSNKGLLQKFVRETAEMGRDLGGLRQFSKLSLDPDVWLVKAQRVLGENVLMSDELMVKIRRLAREAGEACK